MKTSTRFLTPLLLLLFALQAMAGQNFSVPSGGGSVTVVNHFGIVSVPQYHSTSGGNQNFMGGSSMSGSPSVSTDPVGEPLYSVTPTRIIDRATNKVAWADDVLSWINDPNWAANQYIPGTFSYEAMQRIPGNTSMGEGATMPNMGQDLTKTSVVSDLPPGDYELVFGAGGAAAPESVTKSTQGFAESNMSGSSITTWIQPVIETKPDSSVTGGVAAPDPPVQTWGPGTAEVHLKTLDLHQDHLTMVGIPYAGTWKVTDSDGRDRAAGDGWNRAPGDAWSMLPVGDSTEWPIAPVINPNANPAGTTSHDENLRIYGPATNGAVGAGPQVGIDKTDVTVLSNNPQGVASIEGIGENGVLTAQHVKLTAGGTQLYPNTQIKVYLYEGPHQWPIPADAQLLLPSIVAGDSPDQLQKAFGEYWINELNGGNGLPNDTYTFHAVLYYTGVFSGDVPDPSEIAHVTFTVTTAINVQSELNSSR